MSETCTSGCDRINHAAVRIVALGGTADCLSSLSFFTEESSGSLLFHLQRRLVSLPL